MDLQSKSRLWQAAAVSSPDGSGISKVSAILCLLKECSVARDLERGREIHASLRQNGLDSNLFLASSLIQMYAKCGSIIDAHRVFDGMAAHDVVSWTALILGYVENGDGNLALEIFCRMQQWCRPNARTFVAALKACGSLAEEEIGQGLELVNRRQETEVCSASVERLEKEKVVKKDVFAQARKELPVEKKLMVKVRALEKGMALHLRAVADKCDSNIFVSNTLVDMYSKCGSMVNGRAVFERMACRSVVSWTALVLGYVNNGEASTALEMFCRMQSEGFSPNSQTFVAVLKACTCLALAESWNEAGGEVVKLESLEKGMAIHSQASKSDISSSNSFVTNTLMDMYASCGALWDAHRIFKAMPQRTTVAWNSLILGYAENGDAHSALQLFSGMMSHETCHPNVLTCSAALKACASTSDLQAGKFVHAQICKLGFESQTILQASLVDAYGKAASTLDAQLVFESSLASQDVISWNALMGGYSRQGRSDQIFELFAALQDEGLRPDNATLLCVLAACSHSGLVDKGRKCFQATRSRFGLAPSYEQYVCMVDLLGRSNELDEALVLLKSMPLEADAAAWRTLLGACGKWKNEKVGEIALERLGYMFTGSIYEELYC